MSRSQPKARFSSPLPSGDYITLAVWAGKKDPTAEVLTIQIRHYGGSSWETIGRLAVYRTVDGNYSQLPERQPAKETQEQGTAGNIPDEGNIFSADAGRASDLLTG